MTIDRRRFLGGAMAAAGSGLLAGCASTQNAALVQPLRPVSREYAAMYGAIDTEPFPIPAVDLAEIEPRFLRREVTFRTTEQPGTIVVDPAARYAYLVLERGRAMRYGVGVGKEEGFNFRGSAVIARKAEWPRWTPTLNMIRREPERYGKYAQGLPGGPENPLGPRALYLYRDGQDTYYRLHGTDEPATIGTMVSSGCIRLINQDIIDLYRRVPVGTKVVVLSAGGDATS
ncbi:putative L,D-transpeptidase ErfK/SrfK [Rhodoplanes serenus]|uniref:L,D-transpeptidase ErfK/SrfK n=1 Tax=Rhodoplanes serenus TaxID=200615 RepID=A0A447CU26_9BRAD|nr:L,D-transpeptidase [Rhodoplanes serenus]VCU08742.1 putative L,D-transpeptidase ErfK/SrfK [Rhodoplanes serenus]